MLSKKDICTGLLNGAYLKKRKNFKRDQEYCLYTAQHSPMQYISNDLFAEIEGLLKKKNAQMVISIQAVRRLHGNSQIKRLYKKQKADHAHQQ